MKQWGEKHCSFEGHFLFSGKKASSVLRLSRCGSSLWNLLNRRPCSWFSLSGPVNRPASDPFSALPFRLCFTISDTCLLFTGGFPDSFLPKWTFPSFTSHFWLTYNRKTNKQVIKVLTYPLIENLVHHFVQQRFIVRTSVTVKKKNWMRYRQTETYLIKGKLLFKNSVLFLFVFYQLCEKQRT